MIFENFENFSESIEIGFSPLPHLPPWGVNRKKRRFGTCWGQNYANNITCILNCLMKNNLCCDFMLMAVTNRFSACYHIAKHLDSFNKLFGFAVVRGTYSFRI